MLRNALELRKKARDAKIGGKRERFLGDSIGTLSIQLKLTRKADYYLRTSVDAFLSDLSKQQVADAPKDGSMYVIFSLLTGSIADINDLIAFSIKMLSEEQELMRNEVLRLEKEVEQMEQDEVEFSNYCCKMCEE